MNESMLDRLVSMENRYEELGHMLMDPDIGTDIKKMTDVTKEQASLQAAYDLFQEYKEVKDGIDGAKELMKENDPEIKEMAKMELDELEERMPDIIKKLMIIKTLLWKSVELLVEMKEISLQVIYIECM